MNYTYVNSQIKVIEEDILKTEDFVKLTKTPRNLFLKTLVDLGYGSNGDNLEVIINNELSSLKKFLDSISPKREHTDLFFLENDAINIKYFYKLKLFNLRDNQMFLDRGVFQESELRTAILEDDYTNLEKQKARFLKRIAKNIEGIEDSRVLSGVIDNSIYEFILNKIKLSFNEPLNTYFKSKIDFSNILSFVRIKSLNWSYAENKEMFLNGGNISLKQIESLFTLKEEELIRNLRACYSEKLAIILSFYYKEHNLNLLEIKLDNLQLQIMKKYKEDSFGIGIILYYYLKKLAEAKNIRYIYANPEIDINNLLEY